VAEANSRGEKEKENVVGIARLFALLLSVFSAFTYVITLVLGPVLFFSTKDGLTEAAHHLHQLPLDIFMLYTVYFPLGVSHGVLFAGIWVIFVVCLALAAISNGGFLRSVRDSLSKSISVAKTNFLYLMPLVATGLFTATILIEEFQTTQGIQTGNLNFPAQTSQYLILLNLAYAPINEEFAFRITTIGIPLAIFLLISYRSNPKLAHPKSRLGLLLLTLFSPELAKSKLGCKTVGSDGIIRGISPLEWALILVSSLVFGLAHYLGGGGWEIGKVSTAFLAGLVFAIMYVSYGAYADILLHWFFNYYFTILDMASTTYGGAFANFASLVELTNVIAGGIVLIVFLLLSALRLADYLTARVAGIPKPS
jgi:membrane protease YdiL (CAAX protease family)